MKERKNPTKQEGLQREKIPTKEDVAAGGGTALEEAGCTDKKREKSATGFGGSCTCPDSYSSSNCKTLEKNIKRFIRGPTGLGSCSASGNYISK